MNGELIGKLLIATSILLVLIFTFGFLWLNIIAEDETTERMLNKDNYKEVNK